MRSKAALLLSIRKVTQINKGKKTAGVDKFTALKDTEILKPILRFQFWKYVFYKALGAVLYFLLYYGMYQPCGFEGWKRKVGYNMDNITIRVQQCLYVEGLAIKAQNWCFKDTIGQIKMENIKIDRFYPHQMRKKCNLSKCHGLR